MTNENISQGPAWDLQSEYPGIDSDLFKSDVEVVKNGLPKLQALAAQISQALQKKSFIASETVQKFLLEQREINKAAHNLSTYLNCRLSVDVKDKEAKAHQSELGNLFSELSAASTPVDLYLMKAPTAEIEKILNTPEMTAFGFRIERMRLLEQQSLSKAEENLLVPLERSGHHGWSQLYNAISGNMKCHIRWPQGTETVGLSVAHSYLRSDKDETRKLAWEAIQESWKLQEESAAAILNNLADWRLELNKKRSHQKPVHFLDSSLHMGRISKTTLTTLMQVCESNREKIQKANRMMAQLMGKTQMDPWDLLAEMPSDGDAPLTTFEESMNIIITAFSEVSPSMGAFAKMMKDNGWIEGRLLPNKRTGAYCTGFAKSRTPRVYMTYRGTNKDLMTLAHELGHAFHSWSMRDMPRELCGYPMTLAETASVFAETVVQNYLLKNSRSIKEKTEFLWIAAESASSFLINIPARFDFEKSFYEKRSQRAQSVEELCQLNEEAWKKWYGNSLSKTDNMFWAHKLHFHMSGLSFYNFPYTFGYLFSLAIYSKKDQLGAGFFDKYVAILRDTGSMTAEELIQKHFSEDIEAPEFWQKAVDLVLAQISEFEGLQEKT